MLSVFERAKKEPGTDGSDLPIGLHNPLFKNHCEKLGFPGLVHWVAVFAQGGLWVKRGSVCEFVGGRHWNNILSEKREFSQFSSPKKLDQNRKYKVQKPKVPNWHQNSNFNQGHDLTGK